MADKLNWNTVNLSDAKAQKAYAKVKAAMEAVKEAKGELEAILNAKIASKVPKDHEPVWGYRFGKISVAFKPIDADKGSKSTDADFDL